MEVKKYKNNELCKVPSYLYVNMIDIPGSACLMKNVHTALLLCIQAFE